MPVTGTTFRLWWNAMRRGRIFRAGERVGVAVSGGQDSVLLLDFMHQIARQQGLLISVVHFNHRLRGRESDEDEDFVRQLARKRNLEYHAGTANVAEAARLHRRNVEATGRELRYRYFFRLITQGKVDKIATAHTANDQAETVLLRLLRGTGTRGLGGIYPVLEGKIVRPFLGLTRPEIEREVERRGLAFRTDSSNGDVRFLRNRIRLRLLPLIEQAFSPEAVRLLAGAAARAREDEAFLEDQAREKAAPWRVREENREKIPVQPLRDFPPAMVRRVLRQMILAVRGSLRGVSHRHIEDLRRFAVEGRSGHSLNLVRGGVARKEFEWVTIEAAFPQAMGREYSYALSVPGEVLVPEIGAAYRLEIVRPSELGKEYNEQSEEWALDPRKMGRSLLLRNWRPGDRFHAAGSQKAKKLKELFREKRIAAGLRRLWPVLECSGKIVWVKGFPPAESVLAPAGSHEAVILRERAVAPTSEGQVEAQEKSGQTRRQKTAGRRRVG